MLIPTYNNEQTLGDVIDSVLDYTSNVIIVNDGSTDSTSQYFF
jgi:glycosyltransferase involved in cell wall biosynthesis